MKYVKKKLIRIKCIIWSITCIVVQCSEVLYYTHAEEDTSYCLIFIKCLNAITKTWTTLPQIRFEQNQWEYLLLCIQYNCTCNGLKTVIRAVLLHRTRCDGENIPRTGLKWWHVFLYFIRCLALRIKYLQCDIGTDYFKKLFVSTSFGFEKDYNFSD